MLKKSFQHFSGCFLSRLYCLLLIIFIINACCVFERLSVFLPSLQLTIICCSKRQGVKDCEMLETRRKEKKEIFRSEENMKIQFSFSRKSEECSRKQRKKIGRNFNIILIGTILIGISLSTFNLCEHPSALLIASFRFFRRRERLSKRKN